MVMLGSWHVDHQSGYIVVDGIVVPYWASRESETITFSRSGDDLVANDPEMQTPKVFKQSTKAKWQFLEPDAARGIPAPTLTNQDLEQLFDCKFEDLPRLIGITEVNSGDVALNFTFRVVILSAESMYAVRHMDGVTRGKPMFGRRTVLFSR